MSADTWRMLEPIALLRDVLADSSELEVEEERRDDC